MESSAKNYHKLMVLGTAAANVDGTLYLSYFGMRRCDRLAEAYLGSEFQRGEATVLISGGYGKKLFETPPVSREATLMADYLIRQYAISHRALLIEDGSRDTEENFEFSMQHFPDFFEGIKEGEEVLGLVSHEDHLVNAVKAGRKKINCREAQLVKLPTRELVGSNRRITSLGRVGLQQELAIAADG